MKVEAVESLEGAFDPGTVLWDDVERHCFDLSPVPLQAVDTSKYVRDTVDESETGEVEEVKVAAVHDGSHIAFRLAWSDNSRDTSIEDATDFVDKASVAFPVEKGASIMTMGSERAPVNAWYWRADGSVYDVVARGVGTTERRDPDRSELEYRASYDEDRWKLVFWRPMRPPSSDAFADLQRPAGVAFAVWEGSAGERGPVKSFSGEFRRLVIER